MALGADGLNGTSRVLALKVPFHFTDERHDAAVQFGFHSGRDVAVEFERSLHRRGEIRLGLHEVALRIHHYVVYQGALAPYAKSSFACGPALQVGCDLTGERDCAMFGGDAEGRGVEPRRPFEFILNGGLDVVIGAMRCGNRHDVPWSRRSNDRCQGLEQLVER